MDTDLSLEEEARALSEAQAKGLPEGWTVKLDKRRRRKWIAPNGKSCDSIPKAIAISIEIGLLPPDTPIPISNKKRAASEHLSSTTTATPKPAAKKPKHSQPKSASSVMVHFPNAITEYKVVNEAESDPEESLEPHAPSKTVHWNPEGAMGKLVGWRIRIWDAKQWKDGRIILYDPYTNKHKVQMDAAYPGLDDKRCAWLRLIHETVQYCIRLVWAHVKGFAWWPAMVMDGDAIDNVSSRKGNIMVNFFATNEISSLKDSPECIRPFNKGVVDEIIAKNKKKRNPTAVKLANEEGDRVVHIRNQACLHYATKAFHVANHRVHHLLGRRVQLHRSDVNYPYGDTVVGTVRQCSPSSKKCLLSFEMSDKTKQKYMAAWLPLLNKESYKVLDKKRVYEPSEMDLLPFVHGFECVKIKGTEDPKGDELVSKLLSERCWGCVDFVLSSQDQIQCSKCKGNFHVGCVESDCVPNRNQFHNWICSRCTTCQGCWQHDIAFGSHVFQGSSTSNFIPPLGGMPKLCSFCTNLYEKKQYCPNCAHTWDDVRYQRVHDRPYASPFMKGSSGGRGRKRKDSEDLMEEVEMDPSVPVEADWYHPDTSVWGYTAGNMLGCDQCGLWVHAGCSGLTRDDYDDTSSGEHSIYSKEFLCTACCKQRCKELLHALQEEDKMMLFAVPVTETVAPTYHDIIKNPMDLQTMSKKVAEGDYRNYAWLREDFELMVLNALTFNGFHTKFWNEASRFYNDSLHKIFHAKGKGAPPGKYKNLIDECFQRAAQEKKAEEERTQQDETAEKKDLVAGAQVTTIKLPPLRPPLDQPSCISFTDVTLKPTEAHYCSWMECCFTCGSSGATDTMLFCVDCGESFHSFCINAPMHSMEASSVSGWRCPNCKVCEISGEVPLDELKMLFCEMCDRAFTSELLDPPLSGPPEGLWICGQCVDCANCRNTSEKKGASVKHWSRDPEKCFRCGGCEGLVEDYMGNMRCAVCNGILRKSDDDIVECSQCNSLVHQGCDSPAASSRGKRYGTRGVSDKYTCSLCRKKVGPDIAGGMALRRQLLDQDLISLLAEQVPNDPEAYQSLEEVSYHLQQDIEWRIRDMWKDEYMSVIKDGFTMVAAIRRRDLNPRVMIQNALSGVTSLPTWISQRAARFLQFAEKSGWTPEGLPVKNIRSAQAIARMAAAYLRLNCSAFHLDETIEVRAHARMLLLLAEPDDSGLVDIPPDAVRIEGDNQVFHHEVWTATAASEDSSRDQSTKSKAEEAKRIKPDSVNYVLPEPVCGWNKYLDDYDVQYEWKDPRMCCLCRTSGDDDGDNDREVADGLTLARCGRLLPMKDGLWVHTLCALWSSEVYEAPSDGLVHSMEKARSRGSQLKCFGCGRPGASVGCFKTNCSRNYHFPCAKACGAVFTTKQEMFCEAHQSSAATVLPTESVELMKPLMISDEKKDAATDAASGKLCLRIGALTVHSLGEIERQIDGFHSEKYITPPGYVATRIFWSGKHPKTRTVYVLKVEKDRNDEPMFTITPGDDHSQCVRGRTAAEAYAALIQRVKSANENYFSSDEFSKLPVMRKHTKKAYGLNGPQFFGFGIDDIRNALEYCQGIEAVVAPLTPASPSYRFAFVQPDVEIVMDLQRKRAAAAAENALENASGSARTEGMKAVARSGGSGRITRALVRSAEQEETAPVGRKRTDAEEKQAKADRESNQQKYKTMKSVPLEDRLAARRSHIHGWGLFTKVDLKKDSMIVEYMGEVVRQCVADKREKAYEKDGIGSCYMFRLDLERIVDATTIGCMARFMNHCCKSNAYAKVITVDTELGGPDRKIVVFANRDISAGEEITYDYKFPVEDGSLKCTCGAPNCIGRMN